MIKFNALLRDEGIDPKYVKLARHIDERVKARTPYQLWKLAEKEFELYQRIQSRALFSDARFLGSFLVTPLGETLFVGLYAIRGVGKAPRDLKDPISGDDVGGVHLYDLKKTETLAEYAGRLIVDWGQGYRAWVQRAHLRDKQILEIRRSAVEPPFPGFLKFCERLSALATVPVSWRQALSAVSGVYLLTCPETGKQYVGSASGESGLWGRWEDYVASGHGGNRRMMGIPAADYQVTILEFASSTTSAEELLAMEARWKTKLLTREFGLNGN